MKKRKLSIIMPCLNEEETLGICIEKAKKGIDEAIMLKKLDWGEVVIADNGSTDNSLKIARKHRVQIAHIKQKGYGAALIGGIEKAKGDYMIMADADDSYDFTQAPRFVSKLNEGYDIVMGSRLKGKIMKGAMPFLHRYLGNPVLSLILRILFRSKISDSHCGLRGFTKEAVQKMKLQSPGMEFASEMGIHAAILKLNVTEIPITLYPDGRSSSPHLRTFTDGWRHLKFMLLYKMEVLFAILLSLSIAALVTAVEIQRGPILSTGLTALTVLFAEFFLWARQFPFRPEIQIAKTKRAKNFKLKNYWFFTVIVSILLVAVSFVFPESKSSNMQETFSVAQWRYMLQMAAIFILFLRFVLGWMREQIRVRLNGMKDF